MSKRTCTTPGCDKPHRARGLCSTHYNRTYAPDRHRIEKVCEACGTGYTTTRTNGRYCSLACRDAEARRRKVEREAARQARPRADRRSPLRRAMEDGPAPAVLRAIRENAQPAADGCWLWQGRIDRHGYPVARVGAREYMVHRVALEARLGAPLGRQPAHHTCAVTRCVNPDHLQPVTHRDNVAEMLARNYMVQRIADLESALAAHDPTHPLLAEVGVPRPT